MVNLSPSVFVKRSFLFAVNKYRVNPRVKRHPAKDIGVTTTQANKYQLLLRLASIISSTNLQYLGKVTENKH